MIEGDFLRVGPINSTECSTCDMKMEKLPSKELFKKCLITRRPVIVLQVNGYYLTLLELKKTILDGEML